MMKHTLSLCCIVLVCTLACGGSQASVSQPDTKQARGHVIDVIPRNITEVETLRIRDDSGRELTFTSEGFAGFTPSHLREHQLFGLSVLVFYVEKGDRLVAVDIKD
jgi:hypothetical protein